MANTVDIIFRAVGMPQVTAAVQGVRNQIAGLATMASTMAAGAVVGAVGAAITAAIAGAHQALAAAEESRIAQFQLAQALRATGQASEQNVAALAEQANALQTLTGIADETVMAVQKVLLSMGATAEQAHALTPLVLDVSAAMGVDATTAARQMGAALDGEEIKLGKLNIQAKSFSDLVGQLTDRFGGQAAAMREARGESAALSTAWGELQEKAGGIIHEWVTPMVSALAQFLQISDAFVSRFGASLSQIAKSFGEINPVVLALQAVNSLLGKYVPKATEPTKPAAAPAGASGPKEMLPGEYESRRKLIDLQIEENRLAQAQDAERLRNSPKLIAQNLEFLRIEQQLLEARRALINDAPKAIDEQQLRKEQLETSERMLAIERQRRELQDAPAGSLFAGQRDRFAQYQLAQEYDSQQSPGAVVTAGLQETLVSLGTTAQQVAGVIRDTIGNAIQSISAGISGLILGTMTWGQAIAQVGRQILSSLVQGIVQFFVTWITQRLLSALVGASIAASEAASLSAIWAGPAILASIATSGGAAAAGPPAVTAALSAAPAVAGQAAAGFLVGGYTGDGPTGEVAGVVHRREMVFSAPAVAAIGRTNLEALHASALTGGPGASSDTPPTRIVIVDDRQRLDALIRDPRFRNAVVDLASR